LFPFFVSRSPVLYILISKRETPPVASKKASCFLVAQFFFLHKQGQDNTVFIKWWYVQMLCTLLLYEM